MVGAGSVRLIPNGPGKGRWPAAAARPVLPAPSATPPSRRSSRTLSQIDSAGVLSTDHRPNGFFEHEPFRHRRRSRCPPSYQPVCLVVARIEQFGAKGLSFGVIFAGEAEVCRARIRLPAKLRLLQTGALPG